MKKTGSLAAMIAGVVFLFTSTCVASAQDLTVTDICPSCNLYDTNVVASINRNGPIDKPFDICDIWDCRLAEAKILAEVQSPASPVRMHFPLCDLGICSLDDMPFVAARTSDCTTAPGPCRFFPERAQPRF